MNLEEITVKEHRSKHPCSEETWAAVKDIAVKELCNKKLYVFGKGKTDEVAKKYGTRKLLEIPIDEGVRTLVDDGNVESVDVLIDKTSATEIPDNIYDKLFAESGKCSEHRR